MSGDKIEQAKAALRQALNPLGGQDRFRLIAFSNRVTNFRDGFAAASPENLEAARRFVDGLQADGGTNIAGALGAALSAGARVGRPRIFPFGVGHDVNTYLLDRLAQEGRGTAEYVAPEANVEAAVGALLNKIRHPALANLRIEHAPVGLVQTYPSRLPDVFFGEELVIFGRYHGTGGGEIVVSGQRGGRTERFTAPAVL